MTPGGDHERERPASEAGSDGPQAYRDLEQTGHVVRLRHPLSYEIDVVSIADT